MRPMLIFLRELRSFSGIYLYVNLLGMIMVSLFEGFSIFMLLPMLGAIGIIDFSLTGSLPFASIVEPIRNLPETWILPIVLCTYIVLIIGISLFQRNISVLNIKIQQGFMRHLRHHTYESILRSNWEFFLHRRKSDFQHVLTSELARVGQGTMIFLQLVASVMFMLIQIVLAFIYLSPVLTTIVLVSGILTAYISRKFVRRAKKLGDHTTQLSLDYFAGINDQLNGIKDIKSNMLEQQHINWFQRLSMRMERNMVNFVKLRSNSQLLYKSAAAILIAGFIYVSFRYLNVRPEQLILIVLIFTRVWPKFTSLQSNVEQIVSMIPAFEQLMNLQEDAGRAREYKSLTVATGSEPEPLRLGIECRGVYYRYNAQMPYSLHDIAIHIPVNKMTAIVGKSGAGKSTLVDLLIGLIKPDLGEILIDGAPLSEERALRLRESISYVSQDPFLFHTSIKDNLKLVRPDVTDDEIWEALRFSASEDFVRQLPQGLDTIIGDRGVRLSGGERQRIVLARALLRRPTILVLDEATSALDTENEYKIQQAVEHLRGRLTLIVIAHRLSTIRMADQIIVLEDGRVSEQGGFKQLTENSKGTFSQLWNQQSAAVSNMS